MAWTSTFVTIIVLMVLGLVMFAYWKKKVCFAPKDPLHVTLSGVIYFFQTKTVLEKLLKVVVLELGVSEPFDGL